ncbi:transposase [Streptosporangium sp. NPDC051023]|uniref:transposase n=1 Tax=Streptosporangium sp. NPDC051023 TaxID=3155410 RepID=UPI003450077C
MPPQACAPCSSAGPAAGLGAAVLDRCRGATALARAQADPRPQEPPLAARPAVTTMTSRSRTGPPRLARQRTPRFHQGGLHRRLGAAHAHLPARRDSPAWRPTRADGQPCWSVLFPRAACRVCPVRLQCTGNVDGKGRHVLLLPRPLQEIQTKARVEQQTPPWRQRYAMRAGCEATVSETVHAHGLRHCRYHGLAKTHVQHVLTAAGADLIRLSEYMPLQPQRPASRFQRLCQNQPPAT